MSDLQNSNLPSLNLARILRGGDDVSNNGLIDRLEIVTPSVHEGELPTITEIQLAEPAQWRATASHVGTDEFYLSGRVIGMAVLECSRCLQPTNVRFNARIEALLQYDASVKTPRPELSQDEEFILFGNPSIDLSSLMSEAVSLELPLSVLHAPDCKGLCVACGTNLNHIAHNSCAVARADCPHLERASVEEIDSPFAKLKGFIKD